MNQLLSMSISGVIIISIQLYLISEILQSKINFKKWQSYLYILICITVPTISYIFVNNAIRMLLYVIVVSIGSKFLFHQGIKRTVVSVVISQFITTISEILFLIGIAVFTTLNANELVQTFHGSLFMHIVISILTYIQIKISCIKRLCIQLLNWIENISYKQLAIIIVVLVCIINFILVSVYYKVNLIFLVMLNSLIITFVSFTVYKVVEQQSLNVQYRTENDALQDSLHTYENLVDHHRVISHENKNQLGVIKQMVESDDKTVVQYIEKLIKQTYKKDESLLEKTKRIPSGGLQGIIYQKLLLMKEKDIPYALNISRDIKISDFKKLDMDTNIDLCKIVGVFLDNAIDEVKRVDNKKIIVDVYMEDGNFCIKVTNDYGPGIDFSKIDNKGYTTKEDGHGYGLSLVKEILERNHRFTNLRTITGKTFGQIIMVNNMSIDE